MNFEFSLNSIKFYIMAQLNIKCNLLVNMHTAFILKAHQCDKSNPTGSLGAAFGALGYFLRANILLYSLLTKLNM